MVDIAFVEAVARAGGTEAVKHFRTGTAIDNKMGPGDFDPVTEGDRAAERVMRAMITERHPDHGILGEEYGLENEAAPTRWVLDPIDGTRSFMMGLPTWGTLVGVRSGGKAISGAMYQPFTDELYSGDGNRATLTRGEEISVLSTSACTGLSSAVMTTTSPYLYSNDRQPCFKALEHKVRLSRYGGDCYGFALLAAGFVDIAMDGGLQTYDIAALIPIIEGAGGVVTTWEGNSALDGGDIVAAASPDLHAAVLDTLTS